MVATPNGPQACPHTDESGVYILGECIYEIAATENCVDCCYGAEVNPTGDPIGGGVGYRDILSVGEATVVIEPGLDAVPNFLAALENAQDGDIIFIRGEAELDLTGQVDIRVPAGVTIASDRGKFGSNGALIKLTNITLAHCSEPRAMTYGYGIRDPWSEPVYGRSSLLHAR